MNTTLDVAAMLSACIWPIVVLAILLTFRKPLGLLLSGLSGRLTKLSAFNVSIELVTLTSPREPWTNPNIPEHSEISGGDVVDTTHKTLFDRISADTPWDYLIVDVKDGQFWFVSRVFIFTVFLQAIRDLKCVVFVQTSGEFHRRLLGIASPAAVRMALVRAFPWMEEALARALHPYRRLFLEPTLPLSDAGQIIQAFIRDRDMKLDCQPEEYIKSTNNCDIPTEQRPTDPVIPSEWTRRGSMNTWEHTQWLNLDIINTVLRKSFFEWDSSHYKELSGILAEKWSQELLHRKAPFIALVNSKDEFQRLLDRQKLVALVAETLIE